MVIQLAISCPQCSDSFLLVLIFSVPYLSCWGVSNQMEIKPFSLESSNPSSFLYPDIWCHSYWLFHSTEHVPICVIMSCKWSWNVLFFPSAWVSLIATMAMAVLELSPVKYFERVRYLILRCFSISNSCWKYSCCVAGPCILELCSIYWHPAGDNLIPCESYFVAITCQVQTVLCTNVTPPSWNGIVLGELTWSWAVSNFWSSQVLPFTHLDYNWTNSS